MRIPEPGGVAGADTDWPPLDRAELADPWPPSAGDPAGGGSPPPADGDLPLPARDADIPLWDPEREAEEEGIRISVWPDLGYLGLYTRSRGRGYIALHADLDEPSAHPLRRCVVAHELAHHFLHAGAYVSPHGCRRTDLFASHVESQAERWAAERLIPVALVRGISERDGPMGQEAVAALADLCQVPVRYAAWWVEDLDNRGVLLPRRFQ